MAVLSVHLFGTFQLSQDDRPVAAIHSPRLLPELLAERAGLPRPGPHTESWQRHRLFEALALGTTVATALATLQERPSVRIAVEVKR